MQKKAVVRIGIALAFVLLVLLALHLFVPLQRLPLACRIAALSARRDSRWWSIHDFSIPALDAFCKVVSGSYDFYPSTGRLIAEGHLNSNEEYYLTLAVPVQLNLTGTRMVGLAADKPVLTVYKVTKSQRVRNMITPEKQPDGVLVLHMPSAYHGQLTRLELRVLKVVSGVGPIEDLVTSNGDLSVLGIDMDDAPQAHGEQTDNHAGNEH